MTQKHKFNKSWKFDDETIALINSIQAKFDVSEEEKRIIRGRIAASGKTLSYTIALESSLEAGAGFIHPALIVSPHKLDKRGDIVDLLESLGIADPLENTIG